MRRVTTLALAAWTLATAASSQSWRAESNEAEDLTAAIAVWPSGHALVVRCQSDDLQVLLRFPTEVGRGGTFDLEGGRAMGLTLPWHQETGAVVFAREPSRAARWLLGGGNLTVRAGDDTSILGLPDDPGPVRSALHACDRPEVDERDQLRWAGEISGWRVRPRPTQPPAWRRGDYEQAEVVLTCVVADRDGRLRDCVAERETPAGEGYGEAAIDMARTGRLQIDPETNPMGALVTFTIPFMLAN